MSALYKIEVLSIEDNLLTINTKVIHPDAMYINDSIGFALQIICKHEFEEYPLGKEISNGNLSDSEWMSNYANGFIESVTILERLNQPSQEVLDDYNDPYWENSEDWMSVIFEIKVTHSDWLDHIYKNDSWETAAYDPSNYYKKDVPPILPSSKTVELSTDYNTKGWLAIPSFIIDVKNTLPSLVHIPRYAENAYDLTTKVETHDITQQLIDSYAGKIVFAQGNYGRSMGICIPKEDKFIIYSITDGGTGSSYFNFDDTEYIGLAGFKDIERIGSPLTYSGILDYSPFGITNAIVEGNKVSLSIVGISDIENFKYNIKDKANAFQFICSDFIDSFSEINPDFEAYPICKAISYLYEKNNFDWMSNFYGKYTEGFVKDFSISSSAEPFPKFDNLSTEEIRDYIERKKWPVTTLTIEFYEPDFLESFHDFTPYTTSLDSLHFDEGEYQSCEPISWKELEQEIKESLPELVEEEKKSEEEDEENEKEENSFNSSINSKETDQSPLSKVLLIGGFLLAMGLVYYLMN